MDGASHRAPEIAPVGFALFIRALAGPALERPHEAVGEEDMRGQPVPQPTLAGRLWLRGNPEPSVGLAQAHALQECDVGDALCEPNVALRRSHRAAEVSFQPVMPRTRPHAMKHAFAFRGEEVTRLPCGSERRVQRLTRFARVLLRLLVQAVDFRRDGGSEDRVHDASPVVSRKLSAS